MRKTDLNAIYISDRVQETLRPVSVSALTAVVAPMGYGKTTAVNWFLNQRRQTEAAVILRVNIYSDNRFIFWKSVQNAFAAAGLTALAGCEYPEDASSAAQLMDDLCAVLAGDTPCPACAMMMVVVPRSIPISFCAINSLFLSGSSIETTAC